MPILLRPLFLPPLLPLPFPSLFPHPRLLPLSAKPTRTSPSHAIDPEILQPKEKHPEASPEEEDPPIRTFEEVLYGGVKDEGAEGEAEEGGFGLGSGFRGLEEEKDFDRDPELGEILGSCLEDPQKAQAKVDERIRKKRGKILQTKTGSSKPMVVLFNDFGFSNSYIWFEFRTAPLPNDISLICNTIRSWHIIGRLGGCNSMNMQLSQSPLDNKRPSYDAIEGANVTPTTFYNIGDLEIQDNLARIWVDIGTTEPLLIDVLINALVNVNSDYVGIKKLVFGGKEFENWKENLSEEAGFSTHKI